MNDEELAALKAFEDEVVARLFVLNAKRAEEEKAANPAPAKHKKKKAPRASERQTQLALPTESRQEDSE